MSFTAGTRSIASEINVTPLIDVLLVLLIIFMVIAPVQSHGLGAAVPQPSHSAPSTVVAEPIVVQVTYKQSSQPGYSINHQGIVLGELQSKLASVLAMRSDRTAFLAADSSLDLEQVTEVMDRMHRAGVSEIGILTRKDCNQVGC